MEYITNSEKETKKLAQDLAKRIQQENLGNVVALNGDLGAGKTTFVQGFAQGLGIKEKIISPTFVLIRQHLIPGGNLLYHIDLYRLNNEKGFEELGLKELLDNPNNLLLIEWAEKIEKYLPKNTVKIRIEKMNPKQRKFTVLS